MGELDGKRRIHLVGAGGSGMSGIAKLLAQLGYEVSGSDLKPGRLLDVLADLGVTTWVGHAPQRVTEWDLVVASSAVPDRDPELEAARSRGLPVWRRPQLLGALTDGRPTLGFTGTHGKTTATALAVAAVRATGMDPSFLLGGELVALNTGAHLGRDGLFLLEADEAFGTFLELHLEGLLVANVEADHLDHYRTLGALEEAFVRVAAGVSGPVVAGIDDAGARRLAERVGAVGYGISPDADWVIDRVEHGPWSVSFRLQGRGAAYDVQVPRPGLHVARNAAGVLALLGEAGLDVGAAAAGLTGFAGVRRRYQVRARIGGVTVVDDYAHHPTEIAATIAAARLGEWDRVWAVFQPHLYSRTAELAPALGASLVAADRVVVTDVYGARESPQPGVTGRLVADAATAAGSPRVEYIPARRSLAPYLAEEVGAGDLVLLLGAGDITLVADELAELLGSFR